jgi:hypothetical protein
MILGVGLVAIVIGLGLVVFLAWMAYRSAQVENDHALAQVTFLACVAPFALFFLEAGGRMLAGKPSTAGSVLSLSTWALLRAWGAALALWLLYLGSKGNLAAALIGAVAYGSASWQIHRRIQELKAGGRANAAA